jgi:hypothetical protein
VAGPETSANTPRPGHPEAADPAGSAPAASVAPADAAVTGLSRPAATSP